MNSRTRGGVVAASVGLATLVVIPWVPAELPPLIPREVFFPPPPAMRDLRLSPDGGQLSYLAPDAEGTPQLWIRDLDRATTRQLTAAESPGVSSYGWAENGRFMCYERRQDAGSRLVAVDLASGAERTLIGIDGARIGTLTTRPAAPDEMLVGLRLRDTPGVSGVTSSPPMAPFGCARFSARGATAAAKCSCATGHRIHGGHGCRPTPVTAWRSRPSAGTAGPCSCEPTSEPTRPGSSSGRTHGSSGRIYSSLGGLHRYKR